ncbi:hypothetical protein HOP50_14g71700 [Chloropicon primus]|uniref:DNA-directed RNA polymerase III subunit RPC3 n=1 Tax=Chloropicon primus TaxID=1764295 RepID=A0A5B8MYF5_9CHLO|nr:hypothetical protein A3770_14p71500 [Chloropicon primus]UPR03840.1 hypothetical protein HOP50_14g71700 [Chloropicon primus]|eukprot:QDZ24632.1 hypothetical protein A3770_14p71500 [Chloropicon primus]
MAPGRPGFESRRGNEKKNRLPRSIVWGRWPGCRDSREREGVKLSLWILTKLNVVRSYLCTSLLSGVEEKRFIYMLDTDYAFVLTRLPNLMLEVWSDLGKVGEYVLEALIFRGRLSRSEAVGVSKGLCEEAELQLGFGPDDFGEAFDRLVTMHYVERVPSAQLPPPWELTTVEESMKRVQRKAKAAYDRMLRERFELDLGEREESSVLWRVKAQERMDRPYLLFSLRDTTPLIS